MKRMFCVLFALLMLLSCTVASADSFTDLFGGFEHVNAYLDPVSNDCTVKPKVSAFTAYATDDRAFLPVFARNGDVLTVLVAKKGNSLVETWYAYVMVVTDQYTYKINAKNNGTSSITVENELYSCFLLPREAMAMFKDIATSENVTVRYSIDSTHGTKTDFQLSDESKALFGAVYEAYMKYDAVLDNDLMDRVMDGKAYDTLTFSREANIKSLWD